MTILQSLLDSAVLGLGHDIFVFLGLFLIIMLISFRYGLPLPLLFVIGFLFTFLIGTMTVNDIPILPEVLIVLLTIVFGLILGMLSYFFFYRRG